MKLNSLNRLAVRPMRGALIMSAALVAASACALTQTPPEPGTHQVTRAELLHELEELKSVGYNPSQGDYGDYPADLQAAEQRLEAKHRAERNALMGGNQAAQTKPMP
ncbi:DUF4148 domain-containing protein [Cupriavidus sp. CV2]|uniref:DUF4148 domain-containing protein n=1 Tax=Cupriavidus ulmosensis TaxID=3065913 RepID=UPI00296B463B|nr:DUF4148 domain-containing protein [Cupriavidus sp. CV2]MDW3685130.1 DUF4148 domain-containing protein [Cupriavidus sp. CV2]